MLRNIIYFTGSVIIFFAGMVIYGIILNTREINLETAMKEKNITRIENVVLIVEKANHRMYLYDDTVLVKSYKVVLGRGNPNERLSLNNNVTPSGKYEICKIDSNHKYYRLIQLNHPNINDATEALRHGFISTEEFNIIVNNSSESECPSALNIFTPSLGIHGTGRYDFIFKNLPFVFDWTDGSIAIGNKGIDELCSVVSIGTKVIIK